MSTQTLTGKQSVLMAMAGQRPDRIPVFVSAYWDYWVRAASALPFDWAYGGFDKCLEIELKAASRHDGAWLHRTGAGRATPLTKQAEPPQNLAHSGPPPWTKLIEKHLPHLVSFEEAAREPVRERADIPRVLAADQLFLGVGEDTIYMAAVVEGLGESALVAASGFALFPHVRRCLGGIERTMMALVDSPDVVEATLDAVVEVYARNIQAYSSSGVGAIWNGAYNEGADMINPALWRRMIYPRHEQIVSMVHQAGMKAVCWFLGDCIPLVEDIARAGYDLLALEQPRANYRSDVGEMRQRVGNDLCLTGWVPELSMIQDDREQIARCVEEQVAAAGREGSFIFSTSMLDSSVDPETVDYLCEKVKECSA